ncbi:MAG: glycogen/starch/alpha-glucan phosphorylase [Ruminococcaceae bacterium]|nr:glycogen/starch/alpha-glucan phosphorylase [Oscillospiraceae bacterium]
MQSTKLLARCLYSRELSDLSPQELHDVVSRAVMGGISENWQKSMQAHEHTRRACYLSAEFLVGRAIYNNLMCLGLTDEVDKLLSESGISISTFEDIEDAALGNGGLGRLAACFLDSAATHNLPLDGYGIRYRFGLFKQTIEEGFQREKLDDWSRFGDPWSVRREDLAVTVRFGRWDKTHIVRAVPYDMPIIGYGTSNIGTLRLWQAEPMTEMDLDKFNEGKYTEAVSEKTAAEDISGVLYPNDETRQGRVLRLKQQYFFCSASLQDMLRAYKAAHGSDLSRLPELLTVQLNDTHPVICVPELVRLLTAQEGMSMDDSIAIALRCFNYTNHTVLPEALEKWDWDFIGEVIPDCAAIILELDRRMRADLASRGVAREIIDRMAIVQTGWEGVEIKTRLHMANLAVYCSTYVNGVAALHTEILKESVLADWYKVFPERFQNKTNGITQRRWLGLCNPQLSALITELLGSDKWLTDLSQLKGLAKFVDDKAVLDRFMQVKQTRREALAAYILKHDGITIDPNTIFDIQIKRLHEYKRQLLNALSILGMYFMIKDGELTDMRPTTFIFGAKAASSYRRAKGIIKLINAIAELVENDPVVSKYIKVVFVSNYNVSYAEQLVAAADISEQISTAGQEASGTGNMKLMLNGAVTLGTYDGANIEIVQEAGEENNYIFGARVEDVNAARAGGYNPEAIYSSDALIRRVLDALTDGTLSDGGTGYFAELKDTLLHSGAYPYADNFFLLLDYRPYMEARLRLNRDFGDKYAFARKCWLNIANAGWFSSDRTIAEYAKEIWNIQPVEV